MLVERGRGRGQLTLRQAGRRTGGQGGREADCKRTERPSSPVFPPLLTPGDSSWRGIFGNTHSAQEPLSCPQICKVNITQKKKRTHCVTFVYTKCPPQKLRSRKILRNIVILVCHKLNICCYNRASESKQEQRYYQVCILPLL